jgi:hypothetical protein
VEVQKNIIGTKSSEEKKKKEGKKRNFTAHLFPSQL